MDPNRSYYRYGYNYNGNTSLPPIESFDDFPPSEQPSGYVERERLSPPRVEDYDGNYRPDNPFLPRSSAGGSAPSASTQRYEYRQRPYSPVREYRQGYERDQMEQLQGRIQHSTSYSRSDTIDAYAPQGFSNPFAVSPRSPPPRNTSPPDHDESERPANQRSYNPFAPAAPSAQSRYSQGVRSCAPYMGSSYMEGSGRQQQGSSAQSWQEVEDRRHSLFCMNCKGILRDCAPRCDNCLSTYQQHLQRGTTSIEDRYCINCQVPIDGPKISCPTHSGRHHYTSVQQNRLKLQRMCGNCVSSEVEPGETYCETCMARDRELKAAWYQRTTGRGLCSRCGSSPTEHGYKVCAECRQRGRENYYRARTRDRNPPT